MRTSNAGSIALTLALSLALAACGGEKPTEDRDSGVAPVAPAPSETTADAADAADTAKPVLQPPKPTPKTTATATATVTVTTPGAAAAPDFRLPDPTGKEHSLAGYRGKWVVLEWINHGCPFVKKHYDGGAMQKLQKTYRDKGVVWLSICSSAPGKQGYLESEGWKKALADHGSAPTAVLMDPTGYVGKLYDAKTTPQMVVIDPQGGLVYDGAIDSIRSKDPADIPKATNYLVEVLDAVLAGKPAPHTKTKPYGCSVKYAKTDAAR